MSSLNSKVSRRSLVRNSAAGLTGWAMLAGLIAKVPLTATAEEKRRARKTEEGKPGEDAKKTGASGDLNLPWVKPGAGMAASVNYAEKHSDVKDEKLKSDRQGVAFKDQKCSTCMLYSEVGEKDKKKAGKCTIFAGQLVVAEGWCTTWAKKS